ncbi:hypothetical protein D3C71_1385030 [compost metagenome]
MPSGLASWFSAVRPERLVSASAPASEPNTKISHSNLVEPASSCQRMMWPLTLFRRGLGGLVPVPALRLVLFVSVR